MGETRTYKMAPGDYQGAIGGEERVFTVEGEVPNEGFGKDVEVVVDDPATQDFIENALGKTPTRVESTDEPLRQPDGGFEGMTVAHLQEQLTKRDLPTGGTKSELIDRLRADTGGDS